MGSLGGGPWLPRAHDAGDQRLAAGIAGNAADDADGQEQVDVRRAQALVAWGLIFHAMPAAGLGLLDLCRRLAALDLPTRVMTFFGGAFPLPRGVGGANRQAAGGARGNRDAVSLQRPILTPFGQR